jgi:hypothetical protein
MVIAETGAATAVAKALPELAGKLTGRSIRFPVPTVSLAILNLSLATPTDRDRLNRHLQATCLHCDLRRQTAYTDSPEVVSSDFLGTRHTGIVDGLATIAHGTNAVVYVWYDNEYGYSRQVIRVMDHLAGTQRPALPTTSHIPTASFIGGKLSDRTGRRKSLRHHGSEPLRLGDVGHRDRRHVRRFPRRHGDQRTRFGIYAAVDLALVVDVLPDHGHAAKNLGMFNVAGALPFSVAPAIAPAVVATGGGSIPPPNGHRQTAKGRLPVARGPGVSARSARKSEKERRAWSEGLRASP